MDTWDMVDAERTDFADLTDSLTPQQWTAQSLCTAWKVRDVVAHVTQGATVGTGESIKQMVKYGFRINKLLTEEAKKGGAEPTDELRTNLRATVGSRVTQPGVKPPGILLDEVVHQQDIRRAIGVPRGARGSAACRARRLGALRKCDHPREEAHQGAAPEGDRSRLGDRPARRCRGQRAGRGPAHGDRRQAGGARRPLGPGCRAAARADQRVEPGLRSRRGRARVPAVRRTRCGERLERVGRPVHRGRPLRRAREGHLRGTRGDPRVDHRHDGIGLGDELPRRVAHHRRQPRRHVLLERVRPARPA